MDQPDQCFNIPTAFLYFGDLLKRKRSCQYMIFYFKGFFLVVGD